VSCLKRKEGVQLRRICFALAAMLVARMQSAAQAPRLSGILSGRVTQAGDTTIGVGGADVEIVGTGLRKYADGEGRFRFADIAPGTYEFRVRSLGYQATVLRLVVEEAHSPVRNIELRRLPNALTEVRIEGRMVKVPARFEEVYARAAKGEGTFFLRQDIDRLNPFDVQSLLNMVPTARINDRKISFARCEGALGAQTEGKVQVYIDGTRVTASPSTSTLDAIRLVHPRQIEAMEVYTGVARIPAEFLNDACAVIATWTKSY
jgi:hypothetical protein